MARTRKAVLEHATDAPNEVLVVFDVDGVTTNELLRDHAAVKAALVAAPREIENTSTEDDAPARIPNPDRPSAESVAFEAAESAIDARAKAAADAKDAASE